MTNRPDAGERPPVSAPAPRGAPEAIVDVEQVSRRFRVGGEEIWAVRDVSLRIERGAFAALMGRSGSGKTTLLNLIAGLDRPDSGRVYLAGEEITRATERQLLQIRRHKIGFVFQSFGLLPLLSAYENVEVALRIAGAGLHERRDRTTALLQRVDLHARSDHRPYELSGGEQQRVAIRACTGERAVARRRGRAHRGAGLRQRPRDLRPPARVGTPERSDDPDRDARPHCAGLRRSRGRDGGRTTARAPRARPHGRHDGSSLRRQRGRSPGITRGWVPQPCGSRGAGCPAATGARSGRRLPTRDERRFPAAAGPARSLGGGLSAARRSGWTARQESHAGRSPETAAGGEAQASVRCAGFVYGCHPRAGLPRIAHGHSQIRTVR